jgi:hypothetical protein
MCNDTLRRHRITFATVCINNTYCILFVCVFVALVIQHANRMRRITLSSVAHPVLPHFWTGPINGTIVSVYTINLLFRSLTAIILLAGWLPVTNETCSFVYMKKGSCVSTSGKRLALECCTNTTGCTPSNLLTSFHKRDRECLLRGASWIFK